MEAEGGAAVSRRFEYNRYVRENRAAYREAWFRWQSDSDSRRAVRTRPRDPQEIALLDRLAYDSWHGALERGDLEQLGPRRYRVRVQGLQPRD